MEESINEHDMTKKMMSIMRGGYKPLLNELVNTPNLNTSKINIDVDPESEPQADPETETEETLAKPPREGRASLIQLDGSYFEMDKNDERFKALSNDLNAIVPTATITSVYISEDNGLVINGFALKYSKNSGLYFTMSLAEDSILVSSENVQGKIGTEVQDSLQKFLDKLRADALGTKQYQYNPQLDKEAKDANKQD